MGTSVIGWAQASMDTTVTWCGSSSCASHLPSGSFVAPALAETVYDKRIWVVLKDLVLSSVGDQSDIKPRLCVTCPRSSKQTGGKLCSLDAELLHVSISHD